MSNERISISVHRPPEASWHTLKERVGLYVLDIGNVAFFLRDKVVVKQIADAAAGIYMRMEEAEEEK